MSLVELICIVETGLLTESLMKIITDICVVIGKLLFSGMHDLVSYFTRKTEAEGV